MEQEDLLPPSPDPDMEIKTLFNCLRTQAKITDCKLREFTHWWSVGSECPLASV